MDWRGKGGGQGRNGEGTGQRVKKKSLGIILLRISDPDHYQFNLAVTERDITIIWCSRLSPFPSPPFQFLHMEKESHSSHSFHTMTILIVFIPSLFPSSPFRLPGPHWSISSVLRIAKTMLYQQFSARGCPVMLDGNLVLMKFLFFFFNKQLLATEIDNIFWGDNLTNSSIFWRNDLDKNAA